MVENSNFFILYLKCPIATCLSNSVPSDKIDLDFNAEKIRPRLGKRFQNYVSSGKRSEDFKIEKIRPRLGKRLSDLTSFGKRNTNYEVEKIRPRLGKRFSYKSPGWVPG